MAVFGGEAGNKSAAPLKSFWVPRGSRQRKYGYQYRFHTAQWCHEFFDFNGKGTTLDDELAGATVQTAGTPTVAKVANTANGEAQLLLAANNEVESARMSYADQKTIPANSGWLFSALVKLSAIGATERAVIGVCSDYNATLDSVTTNAWFRVDGSLVLTAEIDDNTTDSDDQSTGITLTASTYALLQIDATRIDRIRFFVNGSLVKDLAAAALTTSVLQPMFAVQKDSGVGTPSVTVDWFEVLWQREYS